MMCDLYEKFSRVHSTDTLKRNLAIIDLSKDNIFKTLHPSIISCESEEFGWIRNHHIKNILVPNTLNQTGQNNEWSKNYSHTIWLASSIKDIPQVLSTNAHMTFVTDRELIIKYLDEKIGINGAIINPNLMIAVSSTLRPDISIMTIKSSRFIN